jgi:hypothetical protein
VNAVNSFDVTMSPYGPTAHDASAGCSATGVGPAAATGGAAFFDAAGFGRRAGPRAVDFAAARAFATVARVLVTAGAAFVLLVDRCVRAGARVPGLFRVGLGDLGAGVLASLSGGSG